MKENIKNILVNLLRNIANDIDSGNSNLSDEEAMDMISTFSHRILSKEQACEYLNLRHSRFNELVALGVIPKGKKRKGFKELVWYKDELDKVIR